jgi:acetate CoA/acetoacetate CoA-transferase beta subunit
VDMVITDLAVFRIIEGSLILSELFSPHTIHEVAAKTACDFSIGEDIRIIEY